MKKRLQRILLAKGLGHISVIDKDHVSAIVDEERVVFSRSDQYGGHPLSGLASYGPVQGDHRMIQMIYDDMQEAFKLIE